MIVSRSFKGFGVELVCLFSVGYMEGGEVRRGFATLNTRLFLGIFVAVDEVRLFRLCTYRLI